MCDSCLEQTFSLALRDESHYPPRCCGDETAMLLVDDYMEYLPGSLVWDYQIKEMEYSVHNRFRIYCGNPSCASFIHPDNYQSGSPITASCDSCASLTCVSCKALVDSNAAAHECIVLEADVKFELVVREKNYQRCFNCGATIELSDACNHISCDCGAEFCYICGREWEGLHGCPHYCQPVYDEDGYNQEGFHRETGLNREGRTRAEEAENGRFDEDGFDDEGFDRDGFDQDGRDGEGYDRQGFDEDGYNRQGYDAEGLDREGLPRMSNDDREMARILQQIQDAETGWSPPTDDEGSKGDGEDDEDDEEDGEEDDDEREDREEDQEDGGEGDDDEEQGSNRDEVEQGDEENQREGDGQTTTIERNDGTKAGVDVNIVRNESIVKDENLSYSQHDHITATEDSGILPKDRDQDAMEID